MFGDWGIEEEENRRNERREEQIYERVPERRR